jgi:glutamine amidotransferase
VIAVVDYGIGNLRSAEKALQHLGADARLTTDPGDIERAGAVVLPGVGAFGALRGRVTRLPASERLPQMGWNTLDIEPASRACAHLPDPAWLYFVHSYAPEPADNGVVVAWCDYGRRFAAAVESGPVWATQFHPEKSGDVGLQLLRNFVEVAA